MDPHRLAEARSLALHRAIAARIAREPSILDTARRRVEEWIASGSVHREYAIAWQQLLARPAGDVARAIVEEGDRATALRQVTPFAGAIEPRDRWRIWREVRAGAR